LNVIPDVRPRDRVRLISSAGPIYQTYVADVELFASPTDPTTSVTVVNANTIELRGRAANEDGTPMPLDQVSVELVSGSADQFRFVDGAGQNNANQPIGARAIAAPGNGTLVSAVHLAVGRLPVFAGKPERAIFDYAREKFSADNPLVIGDRLDTDILGANRAGMRSALVLTGIDGPKQAIAAGEESQPTFILGDLRELSLDYPESVVVVKGDTAVVTVGDSAVTMTGHVVRVKKKGKNPLNLLRAGCAAIYRSGLRIYGLDVEPAIYS
jgi:hypothetical protein